MVGDKVSEGGRRGEVMLSGDLGVVERLRNNLRNVRTLVELPVRGWP